MVEGEAAMQLDDEWDESEDVDVDVDFDG